MDAKSLRHRKKQKKIKTDSDKNNGDVLVIPPDILKKLGINIDNSSSDHQNANIINIPQTTDTVNNESATTVPTPNLIKKSSESSCLETASLMKKSVFLSPSFVPTLANLSSGEVEISNIHDNDDSKMAKQTFPVESMKDKSINSNISISSIDLAVCDPNHAIHNTKTIVEVISKESLNEDKIIQIDPKIIPDDCVKDLLKPIVHNSKSVENGKKELEIHDREFSLIAVIQNTSIVGDSVDRIQKAVVDNNLIPIRETEIELNEINGKKFSINNLESTKNIQYASNDDNVVINPLEKNIIESEKYDTCVSSLQGTEIQQELIGPELNKYPLEKRGNAKKLTEIQNNLFAVEKTVTKTELNEAENNIISLEAIQIELAGVESDIICLREIALKQTDQELNNTQCNNTKKETEIQSYIFAEEKTVTETELDDPANNFSTLEGIQIELADDESDLISLRDIDVQQSESSIVYLEDIPIHNEYADEANIFASVGNTVQLLMSHKNILPLENETCIEDLLLKDNKIEAHTESETNSLSDNTVNNIINSLVKDNEKISQILEPKNIVGSEDPEMKLISNNDKPCNDSIETKTLCNGNFEDTKQTSLDLNSTETISDKVPPVNKFLQRINIISEEIMPPLDLKELRNSHSPINFSLTPVPLHSIIAPKRNNASETTFIGKINPIVLPNKPEVLTSETKVGNILNSYLPQEKADSICDKGETKNEQCAESVATKYNSIKTKLKDIPYMPLIDKGDLKNNNDIFNSIVVESSNIECNEDLIESSCKKYVPILNEDLVTENVEKYHNVNNEQNMKNNGDKITSDRNSSADNSCIKIKKADPECNKKKKKKKKTKESQNTGVTENVITVDKEFYNSQLEDIVKSTKENSDTNAHQDKVKEIADYIKKYAHFYKDNKRVINKNDNKNRIHSKSNISKSKLCIQGVEKPGGIKSKVEDPRRTNVLKTYTRQQKTKLPYTSKPITANHKVECDIYEATETDLSTVNISMPHKQQDFCLCYDFGRLDASDYDNSYEHVHFWHHDDNTDLDSILSIYNDDEIIYVDRTKLDDVQIMEDKEINTKSSNICWNYFMRNQKETNLVQSKKNKVIDDSDRDIVSDRQVEGNNSMIKNDGIISKIGVPVNITKQYEYVNKIEAVNDIDSSTRELLGTPLISGSDHTYEVITIIEVTDNPDIQEDLETARSFSTPTIVLENNLLHTDKTPEKPKKGSNANTSQLLRGIKKVAADPAELKQDDGCDRKNETSKQGVSKKKPSQVPEETDAVFEPVPSRQGNRKRSLPVDDKNSEPSSKKNIKCGVCNKLLSEVDWNRHVEKKHNYIAWKAGQSINVDDPDLLKNLRQKFDSVGSLKCPMCYIQTTKFNKFIGHIKTCLNHKESSSRRASSSKDLVICGVCRQKVQYVSWIEHIGKEHNYLAWIDGQDTLNLEDEAAVSKHLQSIIRSNGSLTCYKCGLDRKRLKVYLAHIETCDGSETPTDEPSTSSDMNLTIHEVAESSVSDEKIITCGVCQQQIPVLEWTEHIGKEHNYLAWKDGSTPLILDDEEEVRNHLLEFIRHNGGLRCYKCGLNRKRVKLYLSHIETCEGDGDNLDQSALEMSMDQSSSDEKTFKCAVCNAKVSVLDWNEHIGREHNYLAWRVGATPLDVNDQDVVKEHLLDIIKTSKGLVCYKCGLNRRRVSNYLSHIQTCDGGESQRNKSTSSNINSTVNSDMIQEADVTENNVKCGVCEESVSATTWIKHIGREHKYLAWQQGCEPLDVNNEEAVKAHLLNISKKNNGLVCYRCLVVKKYPKTFVQHIEECTGVEILDNDNIKNEPEISSVDVSDIRTVTVTCGVCNKVVKTTEWIKHVVEIHDYMAWLEGRPPLDLNDQAMVQKHLIEVSRMTGGLKCKICGIVRKYAKTYMHHIENCSQGGGTVNDTAIMAGKDSVSCGVCLEAVHPKDWRDHSMKKHYNVAWLVGATPIEVNNPYGVEAYIKEYQQVHGNKLVCKTCGTSRVSAVGFYAHIITCGKTEEETEIYKSMCEICNSKYLRIYKSQHMTMHREKELAIERKLLKKELKKKEDEPVEIIGGRRRAAEKAKNVIEKYTSNEGNGAHCSKCGFASEVESEMLNHVCVAKQYEGSESDESVNTDYSTEEEDDDSDIDSNISDEEREARNQEQTKSKKHREYSYKIQRLPYQIKNVNSYMRKSTEEFAALHLTNEDLFSQYRNFEYKIVSEADLNNYMPPLEESCKIRYGDDDTWVTYKRFEAKKDKDIITMFTGGCIQNMCWVPSFVGDHSQGPLQEYLSVLTSLAADKPRHTWNEKPAQQPALIQIWDCGNLISGLPELVMGLALDCGTVWSIDWCPSGARDFFGPKEEYDETRRLGLCAAASANGSVYVFAVPHPATIKEKGQTFIKLKPVAELRLAMDTNRLVYQATVIKWSTQKGHKLIVVGYANGTTAYFDIKNNSPLLKCTENNVDIVYPYHDERAQSMCIEDVDIFPVAEERHSPVVVAGSVGGAGTRLLQSHAAATRVRFPPHWPAALLAGDDNLVSQAINELEWYGTGRRVGGLRTVCGCPWCGRIAAASAPLVRLMRTHPAYNDLHKQVIALLQMVSLSSKRKRKANDELSMVMEPLTYNEAILKYGIELKQITAKDKHTQQKLTSAPREAYPERFPLADVTAMAFCPTYKNHHKLAMATHAGVMFIINV